MDANSTQPPPVSVLPEVSQTPVAPAVTPPAFVPLVSSTGSAKSGGRGLVIFMFSLSFFIIGIAVGVFLDGMVLSKRNNKSAKVAGNTTATSAPTGTAKADNSGIFVRIKPYNLEGDVSTFQLMNMNPESTVNKVTFWTDKNGACKSESAAFGEFVKINTAGSTYSFFQFSDTKGNTSEIYASSQNPIFQCGNLTE